MIVILLCLFSCSNEHEFIEKVDNIKTQEFLLKDRNPDYPLNLDSNRHLDDAVTKSDIIYKYEFLGYGYKPITLPLIDVTNISYQILDINRIIEAGKTNKEYDIKTSMLINSWAPDIATFTDFNAYAKSESVSKVVKGGFSLTNIPIIGSIFGFGSKKKYTEVFNKLIIDTTKAVYGQLDMAYRDSLHRINTGEALNKDLTGFYSARFKKDLYSTHMTDLLRSYGNFLVTGVETGGILTALYQGTFTSHENYEYRSKAMYDSIHFTLSYKDVNGNIDLTLHKSNSNSNSRDKKFSSINISYRTFGGDMSFSKFTPPVSIDNLSEIDFGGWAQSLKNKNLLVISKIGEEGLVPFYDFLYEENLKEQARRYLTSSMTNETKVLTEPYLYLETYGNSDMRFASLFLVTKYNDYIRVGAITLPGMSVTQANIQAVFNQMIDKEKGFFAGLKVKAKHYYMHVPSIYDDLNITEVIQTLPKKDFEYNTNILNMNNPEYEYYTCRENDNIYMISTKNKVAYTIAFDYVCTQYGLDKPANTSSLKQISLHELLGYRIFAL
ncbi:hypothetical protein LJC28_04045 [Dysgonomonas sp. OttesenSCG-928-D17]|nr:hypothetical protein [Dysgonomonas sp. OttesenSCG-928-D17]